MEGRRGKNTEGRNPEWQMKLVSDWNVFAKGSVVNTGSAQREQCETEQSHSGYPLQHMGFSLGKVITLRTPEKTVIAPR